MRPGAVDPANAVPVQSIEGGPSMPPEFWQDVQVGAPIDVSPGAFMRIEDAPSAKEREYAEAIHRATCTRQSGCDGVMGMDEIEAARACLEVEERHTTDAKADAWDEGYRFGRLMQFDADWVDKPKWFRHNSRKSLVANLDSAERGKSNHDNPYLAALGGHGPTEDGRDGHPVCRR